MNRIGLADVMGLPACFRLADDVFPRVKVQAARRLAAGGWSQTRIASGLGMSQAMVSRYQQRDDDEDPLVQRLTLELVRELREGRSHDHARWCELVAPTGDPAADEAVRDLLAAERDLIDAAPVRVVPEVGMNIARRATGALVAERVLSYPGRLVAVGDRIVAPAPPAFGASRHLAGCLAEIARRDGDVHAIANLRADRAIVAAARAVLPGPIAVLEGDTPDRERLFSTALDARPGACAVHDPGAFGIEPCIYLAGPDAVTVAKQILALHEALP